MHQKRSVGVSASNTRRILSDETRLRIADALRGKTYHPWTGKKLVDCVGEDRASELSTHHSRKLKEGYATGRIKPPGYRFGRHPAHGYAFRSRLELCYANELVAQGLKPGVDWEYEPENLRVAYVGPDGEEHTYFPDFRVLDDIVEVKPSSQLDDDFVKAKAEAARLIAEELEASFYFVTEREVPSYKSKAERSAA